MPLTQQTIHPSAPFALFFEPRCLLYHAQAQPPQFSFVGPQSLVEARLALHLLHQDQTTVLSHAYEGVLKLFAKYLV
jgi:hypothetical protein